MPYALTYVLYLERHRMECSWVNTGDCSKLFKAIQYTNPTVNLTFDTTGMYIMSMDGSKTSLVRMLLKPEYFSSYKAPPEPVVIGVYTEMISNILQKAKQSHMTWKTTDETLGIMLIQDDQKTMFGIRSIEIDEDQLDIPDMEDDCAVRVRSTVLRDWMDKMLMAKADVQFKITEHQFECATTSVNMGDIQHVEPIGGERIIKVGYKEDVNITLGFHAIKSMHVFSACGGEICMVGFSNQMPTRLMVNLGKGSHLSLFMAPKIEDEY